jgi:hypothetical protein
MKVSLTILGCLILLGASGQDNESRTGVLVEFEFLLYNSKPGENRSAKQDPGLMLSFLHPFNDHWAIGLGTGMSSPYYTTTLMPVYVETLYWPSVNSGFYLKGRQGKVMATNSKTFKGGSYTELSLGFDIPTKGPTAFSLGCGYSHQRMTEQNVNDWWWGDSKTDYRFNRAAFSIGMRF